MKTISINLFKSICVLALSISVFSTTQAQTSSYPVLEQEYNNSGILFYVKPHPQWAKTPLEQLPEILSSVYNIEGGWTLKVKETLENTNGYVLKVVQTFNGYEVDGGDLRLRYETDGTLTDILGTPRKIDKGVTLPLITADAAVELMFEHLGMSRIHLDYDPATGEPYEPEVRIEYAAPQGDLNRAFILSYEIDVVLQVPARYFYYIHAGTGEVLDREYALMHSDGSGSSLYSGNKNFNTSKVGGIYQMRDSIRKISAFDHGHSRFTYYLGDCGLGDLGPVYTDADNSWTATHQKAAVDVMWGMSKVYDYYQSKLGRNSFDNAGTEIKNRVNYDQWDSDEINCPIDSFSEMDSTYNNAFWNGKVMTFGQGDGVRFGPLVSVDIAGHEFSHAVVEKTAGLKYRGESGAMNESFADIFGTLIEFYAKTGNYEMGEECYTPGTAGDNLRNIANPKASGSNVNNRQPNCYEGTYWKPTANPTKNNDWGGVHYNSGVGNFWFYLLCEGGNGTNDKNKSYNVKKVTRDSAEKIAYDALSKYLSQNSDYKQMRKATLLAAEDWTGKNSNLYKQVCNAWYAVNVGEKCCDTMEISFEIKDPKCHDGEDGEIKLTIKKSSGPFEYKWYKGDTTSAVLSTSKNLTGLKADRYIVVVKDTALKCEEVADTTLENPKEVVVSISGGGFFTGPCDRSFDVVLNASASNGTSPYTYNWPNGSKTITCSGRNSFARLETAIATDKNGCKGKGQTVVVYVPILCSYDPNDIIGPPAYGDQNWVSVNATLPYKIRFENDPDFASGPAQKVTINHVLDSNVDMNSFRLSDFGFYKYNFSVPSNSTTYSTRLDIRDSFGIYLDVTAGLDPSKREAFWIFESIDPATGLPPTDGLKGFLAVNDTALKNGEGYVDYTIRPRRTAQTGDSIRAIANIVFDNNPAILTPRIYNLIDAKAPTSSVDSLPAVLDSSRVVLRLKGQDDAGGSGLATYDLYYSENNAAFQLLASGISDSTFSFEGNFGSTYRFYSRARDNTGNLEGNKTTPDQTVFITPDEFFKDLDSNTSLCAGDTLLLKWNIASFTNVNLEISADSGASFTSLASMVGVADTQYMWIVPQTISGKKNYLIRALSAASNEPVDTTEFFELKATPQFTLGPDTSFCDGSTFSLTLDAGAGYSSYLWNNSSTGQTLNASAFGTYSVRVTNSYGCSATDALEIKKNLLPSVAGKNQNNPTCFGLSNGSASVFILSGTAPYAYAWSQGDTTAAASNLAAGKYFVTVTDAKSCQITDSFTITQPNILAANLFPVNVKCKNGNDGSVDLTVSGGTAPYNYLWNTNDTTQDINGLTAGKYHVLITDNNGCSRRDTIDVFEPTALGKSKVLTQVKCFGGNDGAVDLTITGGTTPYTYAWSNSATSQDLSSLTAGTYTVLVTDGNGCNIRDTAVITQPSALTRGKSITNVSCFGGNNGAVNLSISGGTSPYSYVWSNSATSANLSNLSAGTYTVVVTDGNGCIIRDTAIITQPAVLAKSKTITNVGCFGASTGAVNLSITGGTTPYTFVWSNSATTEDLSNVPAGTYTVLVTDALGCTIRDTAVISQPTALAKSKVLTQVKCFGGNDGAVDLTITGGTTPYTYAWSNSASSQDLSSLSAGTYTVLVTDGNGCTIRDTAVITQPSALTKSKSITNVSCFGGNNGAVNLSISGGTSPYSYVWSNSATSANLSNLSAGTYTVVVTDGNGCIIRDTAIITQPAVLAKSKTITNVGCFGASTGAVNLSITGGTTPYTFVWSNSATTEDLSNVPAGTYTVLVTDALGCTIRDTAVITQPTALAKSKVLTQVKCFGGNDGAVDLTITGGTTPYTYAWSNSVTSQDLSSLAAGTYTVLVTDGNGCTIRDTAVITQPSALTKSKSVSNVSCFGGNNGAVSLTIGGGTTPYTYVWSNSATSANLSNLSAGTYTVVVTDGNGCIIRDTAIVTQPAALTVTHTITAVKCFGGTDGGVDLTVSGGTTPYNFNWAHGSGTEDLVNFPAGTYTVLITDALGCTIRDTAIITQPSAPLSSAVLIDSVKCYNTSTGAVNLTVNGGTSPYTYAWTNGASTEDISSLATGEYRVLITDANNCTLRDTAFVHQPDTLRPFLSPYPVLCHGDNSGGVDLLITGGTAPFSYLWSNSQITQNIRNLTTGMYAVTITDRNNCRVIDSILVTQPAAPLSSNIAMTFVNCFGGNNGAADLTVNGGTAPYRYNWSNGASTQDISTLIAGTYDVLITDNNNCTLRDTVEVTQPAAPLSIFGVTTEDVKCFGGADGSVDVSVSGGTAPYIYNWSDGASTEDISGRTAGKYVLTVTDNNNCVSRDSAVIAQPAAPLSSVLNAVAVNCFGGTDGSVTLSVAGGTSPYRYQWNNGAQTRDLSNVTTGKYVVVITDTNNCVLTDSIDVAQPSAPLSSNIVVSDVKCFGGSDGSLDLNVSGGTAPYNFAWNNAFAGEDPNTLSAGKYVVTVTDANNCELNDSAFVNEPSELQIELDGTSATLGNNNGSVWVNAYGGTQPYSFLWNDPAAQASDTAKNLPIGLYRVTVTDANGCSTTDTISIPEAPALESILLYPNPSAGAVTIANLSSFGLDKIVVVEITDLNGKNILDFEVTGKDYIQFEVHESLYSGAYFVKIYDKADTSRVQYRKLLLIR